jgi:hypothetical protein
MNSRQKDFKKTAKYHFMINFIFSPLLTVATAILAYLFFFHPFFLALLMSFMMTIQECNDDVAIMMKTNKQQSTIHNLNDIQNGNICLLIFEFKKKKKKKKKKIFMFL